VALGLTAHDLVEELPIQEVSCGVPFLFVPLRDRATVDRAVVDTAAFRRLTVLRDPRAGVFVFAISSPASPETAYSRMFAPEFGIVEDPATGIASGPLGCYLVRHGVVDGAAAQRMISLQGVAMGRASRIHISIGGNAGAIDQVKVGGEAVLVARGELLV
jgi:trans-2,3-dihydro-3-hydroxyanthranilate isomerase